MGGDVSGLARTPGSPPHPSTPPPSHSPAPGIRGRKAPPAVARTGRQAPGLRGRGRARGRQRSRAQGQVRGRALAPARARGAAPAPGTPRSQGREVGVKGRALCGASSLSRGTGRVRRGSAASPPSPRPRAARLRRGECEGKRPREMRRGSRAAAAGGREGPAQPVGAHSRRMGSTPGSRVRGGITETLRPAPTYLPWERGELSGYRGVREAQPERRRQVRAQPDRHRDRHKDGQANADRRLCPRRPRVSRAAPLTQGETETVSGQGGVPATLHSLGGPRIAPSFVLPFSAEAAVGRRQDRRTRGPTNGPTSGEAS